VTDVRVGLIGFGHAGAVFHAPLITSTPGLQLAAIVTSDPGRRDRAARDYPAARVIASADDLWQRASDLDVAIVASPNRTHVPSSSRTTCSPRSRMRRVCAAICG